MTTSNGTGSGVVLPGTGVHANNIMGEADLHPNGWFTSPPGKRVGSMMAPSILERPGHTPVAFGTGGSERIRSVLTQFVVNLVDFDMPIADAVAAPRVHVERGVLQLEPGFAPSVVDELREQHPVNIWGVRDLYFGGLHAVTPSGEHCGDPRRGGSSTAVN
jgi:gamma-glutamyltranspeptidase/glutathione hydrolase